jgi:hypothetical protein
MNRNLRARRLSPLLALLALLLTPYVQAYAAGQPKAESPITIIELEEPPAEQAAPASPAPSEDQGAAALPRSEPTLDEPPAPRPAPSHGGRFLVAECGAIQDLYTNLEWLVGPDRTLGWDEARDWINAQKACGGGWSMPSLKQLASLFDPKLTAGRGFYTRGKHWPARMDPVFSGIGDGSWAWSKEETSPKGPMAKAFNFNQGTETVYAKDNMLPTTRAFGVRRTR